MTIFSRLRQQQWVASASNKGTWSTPTKEVSLKHVVVFLCFVKGSLLKSLQNVLLTTAAVLLVNRQQACGSSGQMGRNQQEGVHHNFKCVLNVVICLLLLIACLFTWLHFSFLCCFVGTTFHFCLQLASPQHHSKRLVDVGTSSTTANNVFYTNVVLRLLSIACLLG